MPPFPTRFPNKLTPDPALAAHLAAAIADVQGAAPLRASLALVSIDDTPTPRVYNYAAVGDIDTHYSASLLKVAALYAAFQLRRSVNDFGAAAPVPLLPAFTTLVAAVFDPLIAAAVPTLLTDPAIVASPLSVRADILRPKYDTLFDVSPDAAGGAKVAFKPTFAAMLKGAIVDSNNSHAAAVIKAVGYHWLNGALEEGGFFDSAARSGVWLAGTFDGTWPAARIPSGNDGPSAQAMTCINLMNFCALLDARELVDPASSDEMVDLLEQAVRGPDPSFLTRRAILGSTTVSYEVTHTKIGQGPLKIGGLVDSESTFIRHRDTRKRFIVVYQNCANTVADHKALSQIVDKTVRLNLGLP